MYEAAFGVSTRGFLIPMTCPQAPAGWHHAVSSTAGTRYVLPTGAPVNFWQTVCEGSSRHVSCRRGVRGPRPLAAPSQLESTSVPMAGADESCARGRNVVRVVLSKRHHLDAARRLWRLPPTGPLISQCCKHSFHLLSPHRYVLLCLSVREQSCVLGCENLLNITSTHTLSLSHSLSFQSHAIALGRRRSGTRPHCRRAPEPRSLGVFSPLHILLPLFLFTTNLFLCALSQGCHGHNGRRPDCL
jgi:hypothetical protein